MINQTTNVLKCVGGMLGQPSWRPELQRVHVFSSPSQVRVLHVSSQVRVRVLLGRTRVRVQQVSSPSPSPGVCGSSPNLSPKERNFSALVQVIFQNIINNIIVILKPLQDVSLC